MSKSTKNVVPTFSSHHKLQSIQKTMNSEKTLTVALGLLVGLGLGLGVVLGDEQEAVSPVTVTVGAGCAGAAPPMPATLPTVGKARAGSACHCLWICCEVSRNLAPCNIDIVHRYIRAPFVLYFYFVFLFDFDFMSGLWLVWRGSQNQWKIWVFRFVFCRVSNVYVINFSW